MIKNNDRFAEYKKDIHKADMPAHFFQIVADFVDYASSKTSILELVEGLESGYQEAKDNCERLEGLIEIEIEIGIKTKNSGKIPSFNDEKKYLKSRRRALSADWSKNEKLRNSRHYNELQKAKSVFDEFGKDSNKWKSWKELVMVRDFVRRNGSSISLEEFEKQLDLGIKLNDVEKIKTLSVDDIRKIYIPFFDNVCNYFADMAVLDDSCIKYSNYVGYGTIIIRGQEITFKKIPADILNFFYLHRMNEKYENYHAFNSFTKGDKKLTSDQFSKKINKINNRTEKETCGEICMLIIQKENKRQEANLYKWNEKY